MIVKSVELVNFRNYKELKIQLDKEVNILYGDNAQGKTNLIESIYVSGTSKSHRSSRDKEMINFECEESHIKTIVEKNGSDFRIDIHLKKNKPKGIAINGIPIKKAGDLFGILNIVMFSPEDLNIVKNGPSERRRFMDIELCQLDKIYLYNLTNYNKTLDQRNHLLKELGYREDLKPTLQIWDEQLINYGMKIIERRERFIEDISSYVRDIHYDISGKKEDLIIKYEPNITRDVYEKTIEENKEKDIKLGQTTAGPHRDDISFNIGDIDIRKFGSQGQQRTCALSLKLSEIEIVRRIVDDKPVLLLDDVLSELDSNRQNFLLKRISNIQTLITCTGLDEFVKNRFNVNKIFRVIGGKIDEIDKVELI